MNIPIYKAEAEAGLSELIQSNASISYVSPLKVSDFEVPEFKEVNHPTKVKARESDRDTWDLFWLSSIMVSVGWNANDDVFMPGEVWASRNSPTHKQFNFMHDETDIIGHITSSVIVDKHGNVVDNSEVVPEFFDVVTSAVLYKQWTDDALQERMDKIIAEISENKWFVSMECLFKNFDYAFITPEGERKVIARDETTSFLTKYLKIYGGSGEFEGNKIGRLLRNFTFSGKGLVDKPANPRSVIFNENVDPFNSSKAVEKVLNPNTETNMSGQDTNDAVIQDLKTGLLKAEARNDKLNDKLDSLVVEAQQKEREKLETQIAGFSVDIEDLTKTVASKNEEIKDFEKKASDFAKSLKEAESKLTEANEKITKAESEKIRAERISKLVEVKLDIESAETLVDRWTQASDEQFDDVVALHSKGKKHEEDDKNGKNGKKSKVSDDKNEGNANADVEGAEGSDDLNLNVSSENEEEKVQTAMAGWFGDILNTTKTENKE